MDGDRGHEQDARDSRRVPSGRRGRPSPTRCRPGGREPRDGRGDRALGCHSGQLASPKEMRASRTTDSPPARLRPARCPTRSAPPIAGASAGRDRCPSPAPRRPGSAGVSRWWGSRRARLARNLVTPASPSTHVAPLRRLPPISRIRRSKIRAGATVPAGPISSGGSVRGYPSARRRRAPPAPRGAQRAHRC